MGMNFFLLQRYERHIYENNTCKFFSQEIHFSWIYEAFIFGPQVGSQNFMQGYMTKFKANFFFVWFYSHNSLKFLVNTTWIFKFHNFWVGYGPKTQIQNFVFLSYSGDFLQVFNAYSDPISNIGVFPGSKISKLKIFKISKCRRGQIMTNLWAKKCKIYHFPLEILHGSTSSKCQFRQESEEKSIENTKSKKYLLALKLVVR